MDFYKKLVGSGYRPNIQRIFAVCKACHLRTEYEGEFVKVCPVCNRDRSLLAYIGFGGTELIYFMQKDKLLLSNRESTVIYLNGIEIDQVRNFMTEAFSSRDVDKPPITLDSGITIRYRGDYRKRFIFENLPGGAFTAHGAFNEIIFWKSDLVDILGFMNNIQNFSSQFRRE